jgi:hypothetical protein
MEWTFCPLCGCELVSVPSIRAKAYFCEHCDEIYFERSITTECDICRIQMNVSYEFVSFAEYKHIVIEETCISCLMEES